MELAKLVMFCCTAASSSSMLAALDTHTMSAGPSVTSADE